MVFGRITKNTLEISSVLENVRVFNGNVVELFLVVVHLVVAEVHLEQFFQKLGFVRRFKNLLREHLHSALVFELLLHPLEDLVLLCDVRSICCDWYKP